MEATPFAIHDVILLGPEVFGNRQRFFLRKLQSGKCDLDGYYAPEHERYIVWNDPAIGLLWPIEGEWYASIILC